MTQVKQAVLMNTSDEAVRQLSEEELFSLFHRIYWRILDRREQTKELTLPLLDAEINRAIKETKKDNR